MVLLFDTLVDCISGTHVVHVCTCMYDVCIICTVCICVQYWYVCMSNVCMSNVCMYVCIYWLSVLLVVRTYML